MKKPWIILALCLSLLIIASLGGQAASEETTKLDLAEYLNLVSQGNLDLQVAKLKLAQGELAYRKAQATNLAAGSRQAAVQAASDFATAQATYEQTRAGIMQDAVASYFEVILAQRDLEIREQRLALAKERREITERKIVQGVASEVDLLQATAEVERAKLDFQRADQVYQERLLEFHILCGIADSSLYLPDKLPIYPIANYDADWAIKEALATSDQLQRLNDLANLAKLEVVKLKAEEAASLVLEQAQNELSLATLQVEQKKQQLKAEVLKNLHTLQGLEKEIALSQLNIELQQTKYKTAEKQYKAGLLTDRELDEAVTNLWEAQKQELQAKENYALHLLSFKGLIGEELE